VAAATRYHWLRSASSLTLKGSRCPATGWPPTFHCANDCVAAAPRFTSAAPAIVDNVTAAIVAGRRPDGSSGVKRIGGISKVPKDDWIIGIVSNVTGNGFVSEKNV